MAASMEVTMVRVSQGVVFGLFLGLGSTGLNSSISAPVPASGGAPVYVVNAPPLAFIAPASGGGQAFQTQVQVRVTAGAAGDNNRFTIPSNQRYVIEYVSMEATIPDVDRAPITPIVAGAAAGYHLLPGVTASSNRAVASHLMKIYADPVTDVVFSVSRENTSVEAFARFTISGYFVEVRKVLILPTRRTVETGDRAADPEL
jgi:hypothetical protein